VSGELTHEDRAQRAREGHCIALVEMLAVGPCERCQLPVILKVDRESPGARSRSSTMSPAVSELKSTGRDRHCKS
jgi:hypothetical protein